MNREQGRDKLNGFCVAARSLPSGGLMTKYRAFLIDFVDTVYEEVTGEKFEMPQPRPYSQRAGAAPSSTQTVQHLPGQPLIVGPTTGGGVQLFDPGQIPGGANVQLFEPGQKPNVAPATVQGAHREPDGSVVIPIPPGRDTAGGSVQLIPPPAKTEPVKTESAPTAQIAAPHTEEKK